MTGSYTSSFSKRINTTYEVLKHHESKFGNYQKVHGLQPINSFTFKNICERSE